MHERVIRRRVARVFLPLQDAVRFSLASGGRSSGKSHYYAEKAVLRLVDDPNARGLCLREIQKSIKHSAKYLIEQKIEQLGVSDYFMILRDEIRSTRGTGVLVFNGMQDHTADSIKSFEGFDFAWFEEAHKMSLRSRDILIPTIRKPGSELWFSWNPENEDDAIEQLLRDLKKKGDDNFAHVHSTYLTNPLCPQEAIDEAERTAELNPDLYDHIWLGKHNVNSESLVIGDKVRKIKFTPDHEKWNGPYHGLDFGYAQDPTAAVRVWIHDDQLWIDKECGGTGIEIDATPKLLTDNIAGIAGYEVKCDSSQPAMISYLRRNGIPRAVKCEKWSGSVEDGVRYMRSFKQINIHPDCEETYSESRLYAHKVDKLSGQVLPAIIDANNHYMDAIRYAIDKIIRASVAKFQRIGSV